jgi:adenosine deaminase
LTLRDYIIAVPKVELHVHLEGSMPPETLLTLARRHGIALPVNTLDEVRDWFTFIDMPHFVNIYIAISRVLQTPEDIEQLARDFLKGQAAQNIVYSEITYTPYTHYHQKGLSFYEQLDALNRARRWAEDTLGVTMRYIFDIARELAPEQGAITADWVIESFHEPDSGIVALGLGGYEVGNPPATPASHWCCMPASTAARSTFTARWPRARGASATASAASTTRRWWRCCASAKCRWRCARPATCAWAGRPRWPRTPSSA